MLLAEGITLTPAALAALIVAVIGALVKPAIDLIKWLVTRGRSAAEDSTGLAVLKSEVGHLAAELSKLTDRLDKHEGDGAAKHLLIMTELAQVKIRLDTVITTIAARKEKG